MKPSKSIRYSIAFLALFTVASVIAAGAQSTDSAHPSPVTSSVIHGKGNGATVDYYYQVTAGPGELGVAFQATTVAYAETVVAEIFDGQNKLLRLDLSADSDGPQNAGKVQLSSPRVLLVHVGLKPRISTFQVKLTGPVQLASPAPENPDAPPQMKGQTGPSAPSANPKYGQNSKKLALSLCDVANVLPSLQFSANGQLLGLTKCGYVHIEMFDGSIQEIPLTKIKKLVIKR
jgi:hypothetical protein